MIEFNDIYLSYNGTNIFDRFNFRIETGAKILLNAPSGKGKTSLFRLMLGFTQPDKGKIKFDGQTLSTTTVREIRKKVAYLSQDSDLAAGQVNMIMNAIFNYKLNRDKNINDEKLAELLVYFELGQEILEKNVDELSGGERQRLMLVILILLDREVYLLDEPTSALDENLKHKVRDFFLQLPATVIVISHDKEWLQNDSVTILDWTLTKGDQ